MLRSGQSLDPDVWACCRRVRNPRREPPRLVADVRQKVDVLRGRAPVDDPHFRLAGLQANFGTQFCQNLREPLPLIGHPISPCLGPRSVKSPVQVHRSRPWSSRSNACPAPCCRHWGLGKPVPASDR